MKIGILETDQLNYDLLEQFGSYGEQFSNLLHRVDPHLKISCFDTVEQSYPKHIDQCDAYLITGSQFSAYDKEPWIQKLQDYILRLHRKKKPLIGICFGHQLILHTLGGLTEKSNKGWGVGLSGSQVRIKQSWMKHYQNQFSLLVSHQDQVVKLPDNAEIIAGNDFCVHAMLQIEQHILTFQGHPEFTKEYLLKLLDKRKKIIGEKIYDDALDSLNQNDDSKLIAHWILDFLRSN